MKALLKRISDRNRPRFDQAKVSSLITRASGTVAVGRKTLVDAKGARLRGEHYGFRMTSLALGALIDGRFGRVALPKAEQNARDFVARRNASAQAMALLRRHASQVTQGVSLLDSALKSWPADVGRSRLDTRMTEDLALLTRRADDVISLLVAATHALDGLLQQPDLPLSEGEAVSLAEQNDADLTALKVQVGWDSPAMMDPISLPIP